MSFVKKAFKKVFSVAKKIVKSKVFKWVALASAVFFTAGVAAGGFAAFTGVSGVGSFFTAVGQTIATGAASVASSLGFSGVSSSLASHGGAAAIQAGLTTTATSATGAALSAIPGSAGGGGIIGVGGSSIPLQSKSGIVALSAKGAARAGASQALGATGSQLSKAMAGLTNSGVVSRSGINPIIWQGISTGFSAMAASKARGSKRRITGVAGGVSHGGSANPGPQPFFVTNTEPTGEQDPVQPQGTPLPPIADQGTVAGQLAQQTAQKQRVDINPLDAESELFSAPNGPIQATPSLLSAGQPTNTPTRKPSNGLLAQQSVDPFVSNFQKPESPEVTSNKELLDNLIRNSVLGVA